MRKLNIKYFGIIVIIAFSSFIIGNTSKLYIDNGVDYAVLNMENPPNVDHPFLSMRVNSEDSLGMYLEPMGRLILGTNDVCLLEIPDDSVKLVVHGEAWKAGSPFWEGISDARLKNGIVPLGESLKKFLDINFHSYEYNDQPGRRWCGVLAQEVMDDFPHSVNTFTSEGEEYYSFNPNNLFFTGMKAIQELAQKVIEQEEQIRQLGAALEKERDRNDQQENEINAIKAALIKHGIKIPVSVSEDDTKAESPVTTHKRISSQNDTPKLQQNIPNPAQLSTYIPYYLPQNVLNAVLVIYDMTGTIISKYPLPTQQGDGKVEINTNSLNLKTGTYTYSLYTDKQLIDTKKMTLSIK